MKLTFLLLTCFVVQAFASLNAQTVTIKKQNASLEEVIWELKQQTRFTFMYNNEDIAQIKGIDLNEKEAVSYTHLDVYKRQGLSPSSINFARIAPANWFALSLIATANVSIKLNVRD